MYKSYLLFDYKIKKLFRLKLLDNCLKNWCNMILGVLPSFIIFLVFLLLLILWKHPLNVFMLIMVGLFIAPRKPKRIPAKFENSFIQFIKQLVKIKSKAISLPIALVIKKLLETKNRVDCSVTISSISAGKQRCLNVHLTLYGRYGR